MSVTHKVALFLSVWCLVINVSRSIPHSPNDTTIGLDVPPSRARQNSSETSSANFSIEKLCHMVGVSVTKPKRVKVSFRRDASSLMGCVDEGVLRSPADNEFVIVIHLNQRNYNNYNMNIKIRVIPPFQGFTGRLTIVLYSSNASKWLLDLYDVLALNPHGQHRVLLTNRKSSFHSEQMHAERHITVEYLDNLPEKNSLDKWDNLHQLLLNRSIGPIAFVASYGSQTKMDTYAVNMVSIQLPSMLKATETGKLSQEHGCLATSSERLEKLVVVWLESESDMGFNSCRSHKWEDEDEVIPNKVLEIVELMTRSKGDGSKRVMRLIVPGKDTFGSASKIVLAVFALMDNIYLNVHSVRRELQVISNQKIVLFPNDARAAMVKVRYLPKTNDLAKFHASLNRYLGPLSQWSAERLFLDSLMDMIPHPIHLSIRLHDAPLLLQDLDPWLNIACFDTRDVEVKVSKRPFTSMGLTKSQVLLGGNPKCKLYEDQGNWLRKILVRSPDPCTILDQDLGTQYQVKSQLSLITSKVFQPYGLNFVCTAKREAGIDLPPPNQQNNPDFLWKIYDSRTHSYGMPASNNVVTSDSHKFNLKLYRDKEMKKEILSHSNPVKKNQRLYGSVKPSSQGVKSGLMIRDCVLSGRSLEYSAKQYILHHGCEMGAYFRWEEADSFRVKTFSFELPRPSFFGQDGLYLHCFIQPCNYLEKEDHLPRCWNQRYICYFPRTPGPIQLRAGPFPYIASPQSLRSGLEIPLWGAFLIAAIALILGMGVAGLLWVVHHLTRRRRNLRVTRRPMHQNAGCEPSFVLLRMNPSRLEQERRHLLPNGGLPLTIGTPNGEV